MIMDHLVQAWVKNADLPRIGFLIQFKAYQEALYRINVALDTMPARIPYFVAPLLLDRAECYWELNQFDDFLMSFNEHIIITTPQQQHIGISQRKEYFGKWFHESDVLLDISKAEMFFEFFLKIFSNDKIELRARCFILLGIYKFFFSDREAGIQLLNRGKVLSEKVYEEHLLRWKAMGIEAMKCHDNLQARTILQRALVLSLGINSETRRSILSHLANVHFNLNEYVKALEAGQQLYRECGKSVDEAKRWKERGKKLFKEKNYDVLLKIYSLAIDCTPVGSEHNELRSMLLSNRCTAYCKLERFKEALKDAEVCVKINSTWSKGHYRLGSSLIGLQRYKDACRAFCNAFTNTEDRYQTEQKDILSQILSAALQIPTGLQDMSVNVPMPLVQDFIERFVTNKDWEKLYFLFLGGSCSHKYGHGGLGFGCDASKVPLEIVVDLTLRQGLDLPRFVKVLIKNGSSVMGSPGCAESPLKIAVRKKNEELIRVLSIHDKSQIIEYYESGIDAFHNGHFTNCIELLSLAIQGELSVDQRKDAYKLLSASYFKTKDYKSGIEYAWKDHYTEGSLPDEQSDVISASFKVLGNELLPLKKYDLMVECYTLALLKAPSDSKELQSSIISNRSMAFLNCKKIKEAKDDATRCIELRKSWFRGYSRLAASLEVEGHYQEAINVFCRGLGAVKTDNEKSSLTNDLIALSMKLPNDVRIPVVIPTKFINGIFKQAVNDKNVNKLRHLFLDKRCQRPGSREVFCLGHNVDCISSAPALELVLGSDVYDKELLVKELLSRGASPNGYHKVPLKIAVDTQDYRIAVMLLQHGAEPRSILKKGLETFDVQASFFSQWLNLGREALKNKRFQRAEMFYLLAMEYPEAQRDTSAKCSALKALSDMAYESERYNECLERGKQAFQVSPIKSEIEATKWQKRGNVLARKGKLKEVPNYVTLAINYAPPSNKQLRYDLLCQRSNAYSETEDFQAAIEDGRNATKIKPNDIKGQKCLLSCYKGLGSRTKTFAALVQCLKADIDLKEKKKFLREALDIAVDLPDGTTALTIEVPTELIHEIHEEAVLSSNWKLLRLLYLGGGGTAKHEIRKGGLATNRILAEKVPIEELVSASFPFKPETLSVLLDHGAKVEGLRGNASPLVHCTNIKEKELMKVLLDHGANPCVKTDNKQTLLHREVASAIDTGDLEILQVLLDSAHHDIENVQDSNGNTLYHRAMSGKINSKRCKVLKCLMNAKVHPDLPNKHGKRPCDLCPCSDNRHKMLTKFIEEFIPKPAEESSHQKPSGNGKRDAPSLNKGPKEGLNEVITTESEENLNQVNKKEPAKLNLEIAKKEKEHLIKRIRSLIETVNIAEPDETDVSTQHNAESQEILEEEKDTAVEMEERNLLSEACRDDENEILSAEAEDEEMDNYDTLEEISPFENLTWEVDCTENVWKTMRSKRVPATIKKKIVDKIRMLADGRWSKKLCKRLEGEPKDRGILLYESKLTKSARILWEKAIAFSARCSNDPKLRLSMESAEGLIFSDIIRVWDIVLDHGDLDHRIKNVCKSHERGSHCIIKAKLKGMRRKESNNELSLPSYYQERDKSADQQRANENKDIFFPPASADENEYHILKFYSFTSALVSTLLDHNHGTKIDFPFKVTELEHAIINLKQDKQCAIILLGRSGTGKTTCCLYRLWTEFQNYWERAINAGPHIPKYIPMIEVTTDEKDVNAVDKTKGFAVQTNALYPLQVNSASLETTLEEEEHFASGTRSTISCQSSAGPSQISSCPESSQSTNLNSNKSDDEKEDDSPEYCDHLHQMFITKNTVLCSEVEKNFEELKNACPATKDTTSMNEMLPNHIEDIEENSWPLFIGARDWLLLLDASLFGKPFFERTADGNLLREIEGWGQEDTHLHFIPDDEDEDDEPDEERDQSQTAAEVETKKTSKSLRVGKSKREVTYQVFVNELWPKMKKSVKNDYHPTLVWTEIRSFIKGSAEALQTNTGFLSCEEYDQLGRKRAPNFMGDRSTVHRLFMTYQNIIRSSKRLFDEADLVFNLYQRLIDCEFEWSIHNIFVDETQDFTQAELSLLIKCCRFPNRMFFTGDTAQSIMRGVAFRFEDLKTLFHAIKTSSMTSKKDPIRVPDRLYQLTHNYRSHAGILRLASSIVNLLLNFFPESFDKLEKDSGLFEGPKPVLLESCSLTDLAMILRGNKRHASRIEFGAHQAVLVVSEEARDNMPEELKHGLVLTIYEAKGLEFDDVLIYNFFKDSHARKEWRVVIDYIAKHPEKDDNSGVTGLREIREDDLQLKTRPLEFDPEKHKVLNSELKFLYTAITRARVNVWFFDEDEENRAPMFEYFRILELVRSITLDTQDEGSTTTLTSMFAEGSTKSEWKDQGQFFYKKGLWEVAEKCFTFGDDELMIRKCKAQRQAQEAFKNRANPKLMRDKFCEAAAQFLECGMINEAEMCLHNAREKLLRAELCRKMQRFPEASKIFRSERLYKEASQCMEQINNYSQAIEILCDATLYQEAIEVFERYNSLKIDRSTAKNQGIVPPNPNRTIERLCYKLASIHLKEGKTKEMERVLQHLSSTDRISFFKKNGCIEEAARALLEADRKEEAGNFLQLNGRFKEAMKYSENPKFLADCSLQEALSRLKSDNSRDQQTVAELLNDALKYYRRCGDKNGEAEVQLLVGQREDDVEKIKACGKIFDSSLNVCGEVEVVEEYLKRDVGPFYYRIIVRTIERLFELIINLHKPYTQLKANKQEAVTVCEQFFGLSRVKDQDMRGYRTKTLEKFYDLWKIQEMNTYYQRAAANLEENISTKEAYVVLARHLFEKAVHLVHDAIQFLNMKSKVDLIQDPLSEEKVFNNRFDAVFNMVYLDAITSKFCNELKHLPRSTELTSPEERLLSKEQKNFDSCRLLLKYMFPNAGPSTRQLSLEQITRVRNHHAVKVGLMAFSDHLCKTLDHKDSFIDTLLQISRLRQILALQHLMSDFYRGKEHSFTKVFTSLKNEKEKRMFMYENGMIQIQSFPITFETFFRYWERGKQSLHVHGDVQQSLHFTSRCFLGYAAKNTSLDFPSIANTVMILEHQLTVALAMLTRLNYRNQGFSALLPESYLSRLKSTDEINCSKIKHFKTFHSIEVSAKSLNSKFQGERKYQGSLQSIISHIVKLMFGKFTKRFNVFVDTFSSQKTEKLVASGVAERVMVLTLTMLANCSKNISVDCQELILDNIFSVAPLKTLPVHLREAFQNLASIKNFSDVVSILSALLAARNKEKLFDARWSVPWMKLDRRIAKPNNYSTYELAKNVSEMIAEIHLAPMRASKEEDSGEIETPDDFESEQHLISTGDEQERRNEEEEQQKRVQAVITIQKWFQKQKELRQQKTIEDKDNSPPINVGRLSLEFKVDSSACRICGITFSTSSDESTQHLNEHILQRSHQIKEQEFYAFNDFYTTTIEKVLNQAASFNKKDTTKEEAMELELDRLDEMSDKIWNIVNDIKKSKKWKVPEGLKSLIKKLEEKIQEIEEALKESNLVQEDVVDDEDEDLDPRPISSKQRKSRGSRSRQKKRHK